MINIELRLKGQTINVHVFHLRSATCVATEALLVI